MPEVGRNDPCPCGSGAKYKKCCLPGERDAPASLFLRREIREIAAGTDAWQADAVPLPVTFQDDATARPAVFLVTAAGFVLGSEVLSRPSAEWDDVARQLALAVGAASESVGATPRVVQVRHPEIAAALEPLLSPRDVRVEWDALVELDELARELVADLTGGIPGPRAMIAETWAGWGLPPGTVSELFGAAAVLWGARPWVWLGNDQVLFAELPDGAEWTVSVLGQAGQEFGLTLYSDYDDFLDLMGAPHPSAAFADPVGRVLSLLYENRDTLPPRMQREVASAGWEVAAPDAYPLIMAINTPAGGMSRRDAADLARVARAVAALAEAEGERLSRGETLEWSDPETGVRLEHEEVDRGPALWTPPAALRPGGPEGPAARPAAALEEARRLVGVDAQAVAGPAGRGSPAGVAPERLPDLDLFAPAEGSLLGRFEAALHGEGLSRKTVEKHVANADTFLHYLLEWESVPPSAVHEYDLRVFLFDWYPREVDDPYYRADAMPASLGRFFAWLAAEEGVQCPWAAEVLGERDAYRLRRLEFPGGFGWDDEVGSWRAELYEDLDVRILLHDDGLGSTLTWGEEGPFGRVMGIVEDTLDRELQRRWLLWREEAIRAGETSPPLLRERLVARQREWEETPHPSLDGETPLVAIERERSERRDRMG